MRGTFVYDTFLHEFVGNLIIVGFITLINFYNANFRVNLILKEEHMWYYKIGCPFTFGNVGGCPTERCDRVSSLGY